MDALDPVHRDFERVGRDLCEYRLDALPDSRRADEDRNGAVLVDLEPRAFLRSRSAALDEAADTDSVIAAVDQLSLQLRFLGPADFQQATVECDLVVTAVVLVLAL